MTNAGALERRAFEPQDRAAGACDGADLLEEEDDEDEDEECLPATSIGAAVAALVAPETIPLCGAAPTNDTLNNRPAPTAHMSLLDIDSSPRTPFRRLESSDLQSKILVLFGPFDKRLVISGGRPSRRLQR